MLCVIVYDADNSITPCRLNRRCKESYTSHYASIFCRREIVHIAAVARAFSAGIIALSKIPPSERPFNADCSPVYERLKPVRQSVHLYSKLGDANASINREVVRSARLSSGCDDDEPLYSTINDVADARSTGCRRITAVDCHAIESSSEKRWDNDDRKPIFHAVERRIDFEDLMLERDCIDNSLSRLIAFWRHFHRRIRSGVVCCASGSWFSRVTSTWNMQIIFSFRPR